MGLQVATAVCYDGLRPQIDAKSAGGLKFTLEMAWAEEPELRPPRPMLVEGVVDAL